MKLTKANLDLLLSLIGLQDVQIVENETEADEFNSDSIVQNFLTSKEPVFFQKYETEILPKKLQEKAGEFGGKLKTTLRKLSDNQLKTSDFDGKTDDEALKVFVDFINKNKDASAEELREQMRQLGEQHNSEIEELKSGYEAQIAEQIQKVNDRYMEGYYSDILGQMPLIGEDPKAKLEALKNAINANYKPIWNEAKNEVELREKNNPDKLVILDNSNILTPKAYAEQYFGSLGMIKKDMSNENATDHINTGGQPNIGGTPNPNGLPFQNFAQQFGVE